MVKLTVLLTTKMKYSNKNTKTNKKRLFSVVFVMIVVVLGGVFGYKYYSKINKGGSDYTPPTQEEKQSGDDIKPNVVKRQEQEESQKKDNPEQSSSQQPANSSSATVVITDAGQYDNVIEVRAFISDRYQDGTCKISLIKDNLTVSKTTEAYKDATTTICTNPLFDRSEFKQVGNWQVVVEYNSQNYSGKSSPQTVIIK